ncbi:hypothetical protein BJ170DRAFT_683142 [Xylariales sp. AK1849]|nr:hypothetical protein BJ170DRAFT_683142 [Xylariales sp. AK1849]
MSQQTENIQEMDVANASDLTSYRRRQQMVEYSRRCCMNFGIYADHLIATQVDEHPNAQALHAWDGQLTYIELYTRSQKLAALLRHLGVGPNALIPIVFERSALSVVALLAVVMAGGAVVPLDPSLPSQRLDGISKAVNASLIISSERCRDKISDLDHIQCRVTLDRDALSVVIRDQDRGIAMDHTTARSPEDTLYVIFTSGTTGEPKGVVVSHANFCSSSEGFKEPLRLGRDSRVLHFASFTFDVSMLEIFTTLTVGGCICVPSDEDRLLVAQSIRDFSVNWTLLTPSVAKEYQPNEVPQLRTLCLGGESLPQELVDIWAEHVDVMNCYGPAECSILNIVSEPLIRGEKISLGRPRNCAIWIVDQEDSKRLASPGTIGEIVIEGPVVAKGYLNDHRQTAAVFLEDPEFLRDVASSSSRFYRTGDLGSVNDNGNIDFFGRADSQVKIHGQRVELQEIEPHVRDSLASRRKLEGTAALDVVVELLSFENGRKQVLAAFIAPGSLSGSRKLTDNLSLDTNDQLSVSILAITNGLGCALKVKIPAHMIPRFAVPCGFIPMTPSGKTDRRRLRQMGNAMSWSQLGHGSISSHTTYAPVPRIVTQSDGLTLHSRERHKQLETSSSSLAGDSRRSGGEQSHPNHLQISDSPASSVSFETSTPASVEFSSVELIWRSIWAKVLMISKDDIKLESDFSRFPGGDSMGVMRLIKEARKESLDINMEKIHRYPTLRKMAEACPPIDSETSNGFKETIQCPPFALVKEADGRDMVAEAAIACNIESGMVEDLYPCTQMQQGLTLVNIIHPGSYTTRFIHPLAIDVDMVKFKKTLEKVYAESPLLRTRYADTAGVARQVVVKESVKWHGGNNLEAYIKADEQEVMTSGSPFNRFALVTEDSGGDTYFIWTIHHMLYDGRSLTLLRQRVNKMYRGEAISKPPDFKIFVAYTQQLDFDKHKAFWKEEMRGVTPSTFPSPSTGSLALARAVMEEHLELPGGEVKHSINLPTMIKAAWTLMISHLSNTDDVLFGMTVWGRFAPVDGIDDMEGPTLATIPVRFKVRPEDRLVDLLRAIQKHSSDVVPYERTGLSKIKSFNNDKRRGGEFQNLLVIQPADDELEGAEPLGNPEVRPEFTTFPLTCEAWLEPNGGIKFVVHFDDEITSLQVVKSAISVVKTIITQLVAVSDSSAAKVEDIRFRDVLSRTEHFIREPLSMANELASVYKALDSLREEVVLLREELVNIRSESHEGTVSASGQNTDKSNRALILKSEQMAYTLAEHISSVRSSQECVLYDAGGEGYHDVLLQSTGLDSLDMMKLRNFILKTYHANVAMRVLVDGKTTFRSLAAELSRLSSASQPTGQPAENAVNSSSVDVMAEINRHDSRIARIQQQTRNVVSRPISAETPCGQWKAERPKSDSLRVLLTGANGFLGTQILRQLLEHHEVSRVVALVRGKSAADARNRTIEAARQAAWWTNTHGEKLEVWQGDLAQQHLGLDSTTWDLVKDGRQWLSEDEDEAKVAQELSEANAYSQTKFVSEAVVKRAALRCDSRQRNLAVVKPGCVLGTVTEGVANKDDYIWRLTAACIAIGAYNEDDEHEWVDISDAKTVASSIISAALNPETLAKPVIHVNEGMTRGDFWVILREMGYALEPKPRSEWLSLVRQDISRREDHPLGPVEHMLDSNTTQSNHVPVRSAGDTRGLLKEAVRNNTGFLARAGYLPSTATIDVQIMVAPTLPFSRSTF